LRGGNSNTGGNIRCTDQYCEPLPTNVDLTDVADVSCAKYACVALKNDGTAYAWGSNVHSAQLTNVSSIACGSGGCVALKKDNTAEVWGDASSGGDIRCTSSSCTALPGNVELTDIADITCDGHGGYACAVLKNDGTAYGWGHATYGSPPHSFDLTNVASISCGGQACVAIKKDNTAVAWGRSGFGARSDTLYNVVDASCGGTACVALMSDDTAVAWGNSGGGGDASSVDLTNVADISCGGACVALKKDGTAEAWGGATNGGDITCGLSLSTKCSPLPDGVTLTDVANISCGVKVCFAIKNDNTAVVWGDPSKGGDASNVDLTNVADISCGGYMCVARKIDGTVEAWGQSTAPSAMTNIDVPIGSYHNIDWGLDRSKDLCPLCRVGTYQDEPNKESCKDCPSGTSTLAPGSITDDCFTAIEIKAKFVEERNPELVPAYNVAKGSC